MSGQELTARIQQAVVNGDAQTCRSATQEALSLGMDPQVILNEGLIAGARIVGDRFENGEFFLADLMLAGHALKAAMELLHPVLQRQDGTGAPGGRVLIATVETDIHDIGKNIVSSMLVAAGFSVTDLGVDVPAARIVDAARREEAQVIALSCLLTTSRPYLGDTIALLRDRGWRDRFLVVVGGGAVDADYARSIGADGYAPDAMKAVALVRHLLTNRAGGH